ncbi:MAG: hypothetical protein V1779_11520 [bacterium]
MKKIISYAIAIIVLMVIYSCNTEVELSDNIYAIKGKITDQITGFPIDSVFVGIKNPNIHDSLIFFVDSVNKSYPNGLADNTKTDSTGNYSFSFFLCPRDTILYFEMFAFKSGYRLWKYKEYYPKVKRIYENEDEINIVLERK